MSTENTLYYGDNLDILRRYIKDESVDLVYLDPPFNSNATYNVLFAEHDGTSAGAQIKAFGDTWHWDEASARAFEDVVVRGGKVSEVMQAFRKLVGDNDMLAYLAMMAPRLIELRRVLGPTGSLYLHCDPTASHYLKVLLDAVFGKDRFRNEIVWQRTSSHNDPSRYGRIHDLLLFYTKSDAYTWNQQYDSPDESFYGAHDFEVDEHGRKYRKRDLTAPSHGGESGQYEWHGRTPPVGRMWSYTREGMEQLEADGKVVYTRTGMPRLKLYVEDLKGLPYQDVWARAALWLNSAAKERLGYPTQKPESLLDRVVRSSSNEGDVVLDPFCGCGTAVVSAQRLGRRWIGIDITHLAIGLIKHRLRDSLGIERGKGYHTIGEPADLAGAQVLAGDDPHQFQAWALGLVGARQVDAKKGADRGIDGRLYFHDEAAGGKTKQVILSVKAGHNVHVSFVRDLRGTMEREKADLGVLITMHPPTYPMRSEAATAGIYESPGWNTKHPRIQILTVEELLAGKHIDMPPISEVNVTLKKAPKAEPKPDADQELDLDV